MTRRNFPSVLSTWREALLEQLSRTAERPSVDAAQSERVNPATGRYPRGDRPDDLDIDRDPDELEELLTDRDARRPIDPYRRRGLPPR